MKKISIKDVAEKAGVSISTVSHALNDTRYVKKETKEKIKEVAKKHNYKPSDIARAIRTKKTKNILFITRYLRQPAMVMFISSLEKHLSRHMYNLSIKGITEKDNRNVFIENILDPRNYDGIIIGVLQRNFIQEINNLPNIPKVYIHKYNFLKNSVYVSVDNYEGGQIAAQYLVANNHKSIGIIENFSDVIDDFILRREGFLKTLNSFGLKLNFDLINSLNNDLVENEETIINEIKDKKITAFFVTTDITAIHLINLLSNNNIKVPGDVSVIGFDNIEYSVLYSPKLTTIDNRIEKMSLMVVDILINKIEKDEYKKMKLVLEPSLIERDSVKKLN